MGLAERERNRFALQFGAVTDAHDVELFLEPGGHAVNGVGHQRASEPVERAMIFRRANGGQNAVFLLKRDAVRERHGKLSLGPLHVDLATLERDLDARWQWNWFASDA